MYEVFCFATEPPRADDSRFVAAAIGICGHILVTEVCYSLENAKFMLGVTSMRHHELYLRHAKGTFRVSWINNPEDHPDFALAVRRNADILKRETSLHLH